MPINAVTSSQHATAHAAPVQPAKKPNISFADLMVASQPVAQPASSPFSGTPATPVNKA
ncbi:hypothetical protein [Herbaspirillum sp.]|uniref:hypothetical protein n=1 Tax=Herbaspirillum sp. TaxID=1890675 RepID=UPI001B1149E1|nr:hypothetical protein [Herbaspirillum sp.]MBO9538538.1 hypothetical protein [Herbaspirillum sp.]